jgi:hypothetical protein
MIKITKGNNPDILDEKAAEWTADVQAALNAGAFEIAEIEIQPCNG